MKECSKCGLEKPLERFNKRPESKDGRRSYCKQCQKDQVPSGKKIRNRPPGSSLIRNEKGQKQCLECKRWLDENNFGKYKYTLDKLRNTCFICRACNQQNISYTEFEEMMLRQEGCCAVCKEDISNNSWTIDHNHKCCDTSYKTFKRSCGKCIRGILCNKCNLAEGLLKSDVNIISSLLEYIKNGGMS